MKVQSLGHVVVKVQSVQRSEAFYSGVLGIPVVSRISDPVRMTFFSLGSLGSHHDFAVLEVGEDAPAPDSGAIGWPTSRSRSAILLRSTAQRRQSSSQHRSRFCTQPSAPLRRACTFTIRTATRSSCTSTPQTRGIPARPQPRLNASRPMEATPSAPCPLCRMHGFRGYAPGCVPLVRQAAPESGDRADPRSIRAEQSGSVRREASPSPLDRLGSGRWRVTCPSPGVLRSLRPNCDGTWAALYRCDRAVATRSGTTLCFWIAGEGEGKAASPSRH